MVVLYFYLESVFCSKKLRTSFTASNVFISLQLRFLNSYNRNISYQISILLLD